MTAAESNGDVDRFRTALGESARFVYRHLAALVVVSVVWFVASLPLVTIGPATLGAYAAIRSLRETETLRWHPVWTQLRANGVHALLLSALPAVPALSTVLYGIEHLGVRSTVDVLLTIGGVYATLYTILILIPTFVSLARGDSIVGALRRGWRETTGHPTLAITTGLFTLVVLCGTALLTVGFVLAFPSIAFSVHSFLFDPQRDTTTRNGDTADRIRRPNSFTTDI